MRKNPIHSAVLSIVLLGLTLAGTLAVSGCADAEQERRQAVAHQAELGQAAEAAEAAIADELEPRLADLHDQAAKAEAAMQAAEVGGEAWKQAREAARLVAIDLAGVEATIAQARKAVADARAQADRIGKLIAQGDQILAQHGEEQAAGAVGTGIAALFPPAAVAVPFLIPLAGWFKTWRAAKVYRGERDLYKGAAETIVRSIDLAKAVIPEFGSAFEKAAPVISAQQGAAKVVVDAAQGKV